MAWVRIVLSFSLFGTVASATLPPPGDALQAMSRDARRWSDLVTRLERKYPNAAIPLLQDVLRTPEPWFHAPFQALLQQVAVAAPEATVTRRDWFFSTWPNTVAAATFDLSTQYQARGASPELIPAFFNVQDSYVRALASTYLLVEGLKRQYLWSPYGPAFLSPVQRNVLESEIVQLHAATQTFMNWMYGYRCSRDFAFLFSADFFPTNEAFEIRYKNNFFFGAPPEVVLAAPYDIAYFLIPVTTEDEWKAKIVAAGVKVTPIVVTPVAPVTTAPVTNPAPVNPAPVNPAPTNPAPAPVAPGNPTDLVQWQKEWDDVQAKLANDPDNATLRQRVWDLEKLKKTLPAAQPAPATTAPATVPGTQATPGTAAPAAPVAPSTAPATAQNPAPPVTTVPQPPPAADTEVDRLRKLLQKPEVQNNAELKHELEELLKKLEAKTIPSASN